MGRVEYFGEIREVRLHDAGFQVGDYIYAQGGIAINRLSAQEALEVLDMWKEIMPRLAITDKSLSTKQPHRDSEQLNSILEKAEAVGSLEGGEMDYLLGMETGDELSTLCAAANHIRARKHGNACCVHGIIEFSNHCQCGCLYCGIREPAPIPRFRMEPSEIVDIARDAAAKLNFRALVLQSGEDPWYDEQKLLEIVMQVRKLNVLVFLSIGMRPRQTYQRLFNAGARAALLRFETANPERFTELRPGSSLQERLALIRELKKIGYVLATGFLLGLPGETMKDVTGNIRLTKSLCPEMVSFGPLLPARHSALFPAKSPKFEDVLKTIAVSRLNDPNANILVTTAMEVLDSNAKRKALLSGGNSLMINVTPARYKEQYVIYDNRFGANSALEAETARIVSLLQAIGRAPTDVGLKEWHA